MLSKSPKYYLDNCALLEQAKYDGRKCNKRSTSKKYVLPNTGAPIQSLSKGGNRWRAVDGVQVRNKRDVWTIPTRGFHGAHFATFPPDLIDTCIRAGCPPGGIVLDPFMGAATTALVARNLGRKYVGIELNPDYIKIAENRLSLKKCTN